MWTSAQGPTHVTPLSPLVRTPKDHLPVPVTLVTPRITLLETAKVVKRFILNSAVSGQNYWTFPNPF